MAKSKARKLRDKILREGKMNPEAKRSPFIFADMRTRTNKTKKDYLYQNKHKNHQSQEGNDGSFYFLTRSISLIPIPLPLGYFQPIKVAACIA